MISNGLLLLSTYFRNLEPFLMNRKSFPNQSSKQQRYNKYLTNLVFSVHTANYGLSFFPLRFISVVRRAWASKGKKSVRNLLYGPRTRLVRGVSATLVSEYGTVHGRILAVNMAHIRKKREMAENATQDDNVFSRITEANSGEFERV